MLQGDSNFDPILETFFDLLFVVFVITIIHNGLPQKTLPDC